MWNPFKKKEEENNTSAAPAAATEAAPKKKESKEDIEARIEKEMDSLPWIVKRQMKDPAVKQKFIEIAKRMEADGVDMKNMKAVKKWVKEHEGELKSQNPQEKVVQVVKSEEEQTGRNEPCPCGSGKKYKKCCGGK